MEKLIQQLEEQRLFHQEEMMKHEEAIKGLRKICKHKYPDGKSAVEFKGNDHNYHYYKCKICGYEYSE